MKLTSLESACHYLLGLSAAEAESDQVRGREPGPEVDEAVQEVALRLVERGESKYFTPVHLEQEFRRELKRQRRNRLLCSHL